MPTVATKYRGTKHYHLVMRELITAARYRGTVTYQEIALIMGLPITGSRMGRETGQILGEISEDEHVSGRPMLSAVAVSVSGFPGKGFYVCARMVGEDPGKDRDAQRAFWERERDNSYRCWKVRLVGK